MVLLGVSALLLAWLTKSVCKAFFFSPLNVAFTDRKSFSVANIFDKIAKVAALRTIGDDMLV